MASVEANQIPEEKTFMSDFWDFRKKYYQPEESDDYWTELDNAANKLSKKYEDTEISDYVDQMIIVCVFEIAERWKKQTGSKYVSKDILTQTYNRLKRKESDP